VYCIVDYLLCFNFNSSY